MKKGNNGNWETLAFLCGAMLAGGVTFRLCDNHKTKLQKAHNEAIATSDQNKVAAIEKGMRETDERIAEAQKEVYRAQEDANTADKENQRLELEQQLATKTFPLPGHPVKLFNDLFRSA